MDQTIVDSTEGWKVITKAMQQAFLLKKGWSKIASTR
jgi:hypothetical protein